MTRETILRNRLEMASHNLYCYSANLLMTKPKEGYEAEFKESAAEVEMLEAWLKEFHRINIAGDDMPDAYQEIDLNDSISHPKYTYFCNAKCLGHLSSKYGLGMKYIGKPPQEKSKPSHEHPDAGGADRRYCMDIKYIGDRIPTFKNSFEAGIWLYNYFKSITEVEFASCLNQILSAEDDHLCIVFKTQVDGFLPCDSRIAARHNSYHSKRNRNA